MGFDFSGKTVLVTGATRGIGRELTKALVKAGAHVIAVGSNQNLLDTLVAELGKAVQPLQIDLSDWEVTKEKLEKIKVVDGLVNNAAVALALMPSLEVPKDLVDKTFSVNVMAALNVTQVIGKKMVDAGKGGSIVNVSSIFGLNAARGYMAYNLSKSALDMMTKQFALELGPSNIRVNSVNPTAVFTDMSSPFFTNEEKMAVLRRQTPLGRFAEMDEVVGPILFLLSEYSTMITGCTHPIDGGLLSNITM